MAQRSTETRDRVIVAAIEEFAEHGFAGARVDRIATTARASKERIYAWFGDKAALYEHAVQLDFERNLTAVPFDAANLGEYARALYTDLLHFPITLQLLGWSQVEKHAPKVLGSEMGVKITMERIALIEAEQAAGTVTRYFSAYDLNVLIYSMVVSWVGLPRTQDESDPDEILRADVVATAVTRIVTP
jgi:AcrR family transcriptional regulator